MEQTNHTDYLPNTEAIAAPQPARPDIFVNRELSWLEFNHRVLSESLNPNIPLMERLKFLSIYFSNLDEFFMVRVGSLHDQSILEPDKLDDKTGLNAAGQIAAIRRKVEAINPIAERAWSSLRQLLSTQDIEVLDIHHMSKIDEQIVQNYFNNEIRPLLSPQLIDRQHPFPFLKNKEQFIVTELTDKEKEKEKDKVQEPGQEQGRRQGAGGKYPHRHRPLLPAAHLLHLQHQPAAQDHLHRRRHPALCAEIVQQAEGAGKARHARHPQCRHHGGRGTVRL